MTTKRIICAITACIILQTGFAQIVKTEAQFTLKGHLNGFTMDSVMIYYQNSTGKIIQETKAIYNNEFTISGNMNQPSSSMLLFKNKGEIISPANQGSRMRNFYLEPGLLTLTGDPSKINELKLSGSKTQNELEELNSKTASINEEKKPIINALMQERDHEKASEIRDKLEPFNERIKKVTYQFFINHPNSYVTADMMKYYVSQMGLDSVKKIYNNFNQELKTSDSGKQLATEILKLEAGSPGKMAPTFSTTDINGKPLSLADFKGKYVLLDFWASWCVPCRKGNPHMIALYNKYSSKGFDVIGVSDDDQKPELLKLAIAKDSVGIWHHVLRGLNIDLARKRLPNPKDISEKYGIHSLPTKILIDPFGKIIGRYGDKIGGTDEDLDKMLESVFNK
jgi:thiol-disulfide isomerase/thioredoxin